MSLGVISSHAVISGGGGGGYAATVLGDAPLGYWRQVDPGVYGVASSSSNFPGETPANAFDQVENTRWTTNGTSSGWLMNALSGASVCTGYSIRRRDDIPGRNPKDWTFEGSNNGTTWTTLDTRSGITWPTVGQTQVFTFANTTAYAYYRINISANNGDTYLSIADIAFTGVGPIDSSGNSRDARSTGIVVGAAGALPHDLGTSSTYDGSTSHEDVLYDSGLLLGSAFSLEAWVKTTASGVRSILDRDANASRVFQFRQNGASLEFVKISGGVVTASQACSLNDGAWHYVAITYDGSNIRLYNNAVLLGAPTSAPGTLAGTDPISIGCNRSAGPIAFWNGGLQELAYYNTVLSPTRIAAHYAAA